MIARFANVLYWIACSFAAMMIAFGVVLCKREKRTFRMTEVQQT
jgi:hypothetical protein